MHQLVILTALTATSGLFGGRSHCQTGQCGRPAWGGHAAPRYVVSGCSQGYAGGCAPAAVAAPAAHAPVYAPAPQMVTAPAYRAQAAQAATYTYPSYYYSAGAPATCPNGACARR
jgi:hypothetical protein